MTANSRSRRNKQRRFRILRVAQVRYLELHDLPYRRFLDSRPRARNRAGRVKYNDVNPGSGGRLEDSVDHAGREGARGFSKGSLRVRRLSVDLG